jgi:uncharacterized protein with HEPN domain
MIALVEQTLTGKAREDFASDHILRLAIQRAIEIVSEASRHIPDDLLDDAPEIPWRAIRGMGNILRHEYHRIADEVVWNVVIHDLPPLKAAVLSFRTKASRT